MEEQQALDLAQAAVEAAKAAGAEWADAGVFSGRWVSVGYERNTLRECSSSSTAVVGVRAFAGGGMGTSIANGADVAVAGKVGGEAAEMARAASADPDFKRLPTPVTLEPAPVAWDDEVAGLASDVLVKWCLEDIDRGRATEEGAFMAGGTHCGYGLSAIASSTGVACARRSSHIGFYAMASVWRDGRAASHGDGFSAHRLADLKREGLAEEVASLAARLIDDEAVPTGRRDVILDFDPAHSWLAGVLHAAEAEGIQRKRSFMAGKEGAQIASDALTVIEDPFVPAGMGSASWDGEGQAKVRRALLDKGVLTTFLHNSYTAYKAGVELTGHASRGGAHVGIGFSNLRPQPGEKTLADLIAETDHGLFIISGEPSADRVTGQVSRTVDGGFIIEGGEITRAVKGAMFAGNIFDLLGRVDAISSDYRERPGTISPALRIRDVMISSQ